MEPLELDNFATVVLNSLLLLKDLTEAEGNGRDFFIKELLRLLDIAYEYVRYNPSLEEVEVHALAALTIAYRGIRDLNSIRRSNYYHKVIFIERFRKTCHVVHRYVSEAA
jgi:hypothetical protein